MTARAMFESMGRGPEGAGDVADVVAGVAVLDQIEILVVPDDRLAADAQTDQPLIHPLLLDAGERLFADEISFVQVHLPAEPHFVGIVLDVHVLAVGEDARLDAADMAGRDYAEVELLALLENIGPDVVGVEHGVVQVDLEAEFGGEAGTREIVTGWPLTVSWIRL